MYYLREVDSMANPTRTVHLPIELHTKLKLEAINQDVRLRDLIIEVLQKYLDECNAKK